MQNRREFIGIIGIVSSAILLFFNACKNTISRPSNYALTQNQTICLECIHEHLFPKEDNRPGASDINSVQYIKNILSDPQVNDYKKRRILHGINWTEETANELFKKSFSNLKHTEKEDVILDLAGYENGEQWISDNITYILESLLADSIYNVNTNGIGWNWLKHKTGYPRPTIYTKYQYL